MDSKIDLRIRAKSIRKNLDMQSISASAAAKIRQLDFYKSAENILIFYPMKNEINLLELLNDDKNFYLPKVCGNKLFVCPFQNGDKLEKSCFNTDEPCTNPVSSDILDLVFLPALMADCEGYRLGYGGGFYDRFLSENPSVFSVLPIPKELHVEKLPREDFDIKADTVIMV